MRTKILRAALLVTGVLLLTATFVGARSLDEIISSGTIKFGVNPNYPPIALYNDKNQLDGFDVDVANKIAQMLGVKLELVVVSPNDRIPFLTSGKIDCCMGALTRTPERAKLIDFTVPVHTETFGVLTTQGKPFKKWQDLNSERVTLVSVRGTTPYQFIKENVPKAKVITFENHADMVNALAQGRGDATLDIIEFLGKYIEKHKNVKWVVLKESVGDIGYCAIGVTKADISLRRWLNVALFDLLTSGFIDNTWKKWFLIGMTAPVHPDPFF